MSIQDLVHVNFDLLSVIVSITGIVLLGVLIYSNAPRSATNRAFLFFAVLTAVWGVSNYLVPVFDRARHVVGTANTSLYFSLPCLRLFCLCISNRDNIIPEVVQDVPHA